MRILPGSKVDANDDAGKGHTVVETRTVVGRLGVDAHEYADNEGCDEDVLETAAEDPRIHPVAAQQLEGGDDCAHCASDDDVEKPMHAAVEAADDDGHGVEVEEGLQAEIQVGAVVAGRLSQRVDGVEGDGHGVCRVRRREAVLERRRARHGDAGQGG